MNKNRGLHSIPIWCVEQGMMYNSIHHAAAANHLHRDSISRSVNQECKVKGLTFEKFQPSKHRGK